MRPGRRRPTSRLLKPKRRSESTGPTVPARQAGGGEERLQRYLARAGLGSRRSCEKLILEGRVRINGRVAAQLGTKVSLGLDTVTCDGRLATPSHSLLYLILHKP